MRPIRLLVATLVLTACAHRDEPAAVPAPAGSVELNDIHSQLNATPHLAVVTPRTVDEIQAAVRAAKRNGHFISISGGRHAMGGQQFGAGTVNFSMSSFNRIIGLDAANGLVELESGVQWPELVAWLNANQAGAKTKWGIRQKQTGADRLSIGGALSSNIHGRGLKMRPMIDDVESFTLVDADGNLQTCSRTQNGELFRLAIGGYGLFGVIATVKLRLAPVTVLQRSVRLAEVAAFMPMIDARIAEGFVYGDFQFAIDAKSDDFLRRGIVSLYKPVNDRGGASGELNELKGDDWYRLLGLAHTDKSRAFEVYSKFYLATDGQLYRSDTHQMGVYVDDYHRRFDGANKASEMISEIYVPRAKLATLFAQLREDFRKNDTNVVYGTVRLIEQDTESFLAWAKQNYAATVFNFHVDHTPDGIELAKRRFQHIIDRALEHGGSYFLTYHRWARKDQVLKAYPQMPRFLRLKTQYDPDQRFQSDWYRHYREMFKDEIAQQQ